MALLTNGDIFAKTHKGVRQKFGEHYIRTGIIEESHNIFYSRIFEERHEDDYGDYIVYNADDIAIYLEKAKDFIRIIEETIENERK